MAARLRAEMPLATGETVTLIGNPLQLSGTPVTYAKPPPDLGADTSAVLTRILGLTPARLSALRAAGVISGDIDT